MAWKLRVEFPGANGRRWFEQVMENGRPRLGSIQFRDQFLAMMDGKCGERPYGEQGQESEAARAEPQVREGLKKAKWKEEDLGRRRKSNRLKVRLAQPWRRETA